MSGAELDADRAAWERMVASVLDDDDETDQPDYHATHTVTTLEEHRRQLQAQLHRRQVG